jgi:hypothetical protein
MKTVVLAVAALCAAAPAIASPAVSIELPANPSDAAEAERFVSTVETTIERLCAREVGLVMGPGWWAYRACVAQSTADAAAADPTGVLRSAFGQEAKEIAAR